MSIKRLENRITEMSSHLEQDSSSYNAQVQGLRDRMSQLSSKYDAISIVCLSLRYY